MLQTFQWTVRTNFNYVKNCIIKTHTISKKNLPPWEVERVDLLGDLRGCKVLCLLPTLCCRERPRWERSECKRWAPGCHGSVLPSRFWRRCLASKLFWRQSLLGTWSWLQVRSEVKRGPNQLLTVAPIYHYTAISLLFRMLVHLNDI